MAYVNVASWNSDQVAEWIKGLSDHESMQQYARQLQAAEVSGGRLLLLRAGDLRQLGVTRVGHQESILAGIARLQTLHFTLNSENLQQLAMRLCCKARSLYTQLRAEPAAAAAAAPGHRQRVTVPILEAVMDATTSVKDIIGWLNTAPFDGQDAFAEIKSQILEPSIQLVTNAQRDSFAERPVDGIKAASRQLADVCDRIIQDCQDSLSLLPAPLLIMTIKRKPDEPLGLHIVRAISGVHIITGVKFQSAAHICGKLEEGDEIVQVNYQTVVGWQLGKVIDLLQDKEFGAEVYLTVKKRPKHSNLIDQVYFKPFRLPNKKRTPYRWNTSPRPDLLTSLPKITLPPRLPSPEVCAAELELTPQQSSDSDSDAFLAEPAAGAASPTSVRHYLPKPRPTLQRRATVTGASPTSRRPPATIDQLWLRGRRGRTPPSPGAPGRPLTCIDSRESAELTAAEQALQWLAARSGAEPDRPEEEEEEEERSSVSSLPERSAEKPRLEKTQSAPAYDAGGRDESFERVLRQLPRRPAIEEEEDSASDPGPEREPTLGAAASPAPQLPLTAPAQPRPHPVPAAPANGERPPQLTERPCSGEEDHLSPAAPSAVAEHRTTLHVTDVTQDESSTEMPGSLRDAASPLREMIEAMDVAFCGLKTSLSDLSRRPTTPESPGAGAGAAHKSASLIRQHSRLSFKGRRVSCKDLGQGDCQGWLYLRKEGRGLLHHDKWAKRWLVLHGHVLYGYRDREAQAAETLIALPGYQVSPATDIRSKRHAFRLHSAERSVVFASDSQLDMTKWMNKMGLSAIAYNSSQAFTTGGFLRPEPETAAHHDLDFSDTDEDETKKRTPLKSSLRLPRPAVSPSPSSSLDRARQKLRSWRAASPAPSVGSVSSLSSLGSERPPVKKKPSLRLLQRARRDSGASAGSASSDHTSLMQLDRKPEWWPQQPAAGLERLGGEPPSPGPCPPPTVPVAVQTAAGSPETSVTPATAGGRPSSSFSVEPAAAAAEGGAGTASPEDVHRTSRPLGQPTAAAGRPRPVPPPRRPRSRDQPPDYVNWRLPPPAVRQTETVVRIGGGGRVERIEERERRPAAAAGPESRRLSVQHRGVTPEGQIVASILSGTHTVFRRCASAEADRLPGYMRPTLSSQRQSDGRALSKQRSLSASGLPAPQLATLARRRGSVTESPRAAAEAGVCRKLPRAVSEGPAPAPPEKERRTQQPPRVAPVGSSETKPAAAAVQPAVAAEDRRRLKKTSLYQCPSWSPMARGADESRMRLAFEMDLDGVGGEVLETPAPLAKSASASHVSTRQRPGITIQVPPQDEEPRTPRKPAMGVSMIGKQRRTPTSVSSAAQFVFPPALNTSLSTSTFTLSGAETTAICRGPPPPPQPQPQPQPQPLAKSQTSPQLGWAFRVLPRYGLQYPPVFTPDTYSLVPAQGRQPASAASGDRSFADSATQTEAARSSSYTQLQPPSLGEGGGSGVDQ